MAKSAAAAQGLIHLLQQSKLAVQLFTLPDHSGQHALHLCLHRQCLEPPPPGKQLATLSCCITMLRKICSQTWSYLPCNTADPEDQVQRLWHKQLQAVFDWVLPEFSADSMTDHSHDDALPQQLASDQTPLQQCAACAPELAAVHSTSDPPTSMSKKQDDLLDGEGFDAAELYTAVKPSGSEPQLPQDNPQLRPTLRPYQRRAAAWMMARETGAWV